MSVDSEPNGAAAAQAPPRRRLTDTSAGQSLFVAFWILGTLVVLGLAGVAFWWGMQQAMPDDDAVAIEEVVEEPAIVLPNLAEGPRAPGLWAWTELRGGECIDGYGGPYAEEYQVVSCQGPHEAQVLIATLLSRDVQAPYPGEGEVAERAREVCDVVPLLDRERAAEYSDLVLEWSYPVNDRQWDEGQRVVYCFVSRSSGEPIGAWLGAQR